jgi:hypothetical protein
MAVVCIAGTAKGIGKTAVAEALLAAFPGWHAARVRVADELTAADTARLSDALYGILPAASCPDDAELARLAAAGAHETSVLLAQPRGLADGLASLVGKLPERTNLLVEGNGYLWARPADVSIMVIGPGPSGKGMGRIKASVREIFPKIDIWAWNTRTDPASEGFFDFPLELAALGSKEHVSNKADYHHLNPRRADDTGAAALAACVRQTLERKHWRSESDEFLRKAGFDV